MPGWLAVNSFTSVNVDHLPGNERSIIEARENIKPDTGSRWLGLREPSRSFRQNSLIFAASNVDTISGVRPAPQCSPIVYPYIFLTILVASERVKSDICWSR